MKLDFRLTTDLEILHSKGRKFYITDNGIEHTFTTRKDAYIYLMKAYGDLSQA